MKPTGKCSLIRATACIQAIVAFLIAGTCYAGALIAAPSQVDLGVIDEGKSATATFVIENTGPSEIVIQGVKTN